MSEPDSLGTDLLTDDQIAYDVVTAAKKIGVSRTTIYRMIADGSLKSARVRTSRVILRSDLIEALERMRVAA